MGMEMSIIWRYTKDGDIKYRVKSPRKARAELGKNKKGFESFVSNIYFFYKTEGWRVKDGGEW